MPVVLSQQENIVRTFVWVVTLLGSVLGAFVAVTGIAGANGSPQQSAAAAIGLAFAVIPYCFARAVSELRDTAPKV
jgi:hypothetical protein